MKVEILDERLGALVNGKELLGKQKYPQEVITKFKQRIQQIANAKDLKDIRAIKSLHFEKLKEPRYNDKYSIRLNKSYRMILSLGKDEMKIDVVLVEEINNHYG